MKMMCYILCATLLLIVACDGSTIQKPGPDTNTNDTDQTGVDNLLNDDGLIITDDDQIDPDGIKPDSDIPAGDCSLNKDCSPTELCQKTTGLCTEGTGSCEVRPAECPTISSPVCGCDEVTYDNECMAHSYGVNVLYEGECGSVTTCGFNGDCQELQFCQRATGTCEVSAATGVCTDMPQGCEDIYAPVCGCDGNTYSNECMANSAGINVDHEGECGSTNSCGSNTDCSEFEFCAKPDGTCDSYLAGTCTELPLDCGMLSAEIIVCGCDNVTYQHPCFANAAGVNVAYEGECGTVVPCKTDQECGDFVAMLCQKATGVCESGTGTCVTPETSCPEVYAPVCGCDGTTYSNECLAHANFMNVSYEGECGTSTGCYGNEECPSDPNSGKGFCQFETGTCYGPGICSTMPLACDGMYAPVCGCDGNTYSNECLANSNGVSVSYDGECGGENKYSTIYFYYQQSSMEQPNATGLILNGQETATFEGADLITRTPFTGGVTLTTTFYGPDGGGVVNLQLTVYSNGFSLPYTVTLDGSENYAQWTNFYGGGPTQLLGNLYGEVTISQYQRDNNGTVTLIELSGEMLTYTAN